MSSLSSLPLSPFEAKARIHVHIAFFAFLVALPLSILIPRYLRTFTSAWFWLHAAMNLLVTGPLVFTAFALGYQTTTASGLLHFRDPHQKAGLALLILYCIQVSLGTFIHFVKLPHTFPGGRRPQNYLHAVLGLAIIGLAAFQTHYGLWTEWAFVTGNAHPVTWHCKRFWLGIVVGMFTLYALGLALLPWQFKQERAARQAAAARGVAGSEKAGSLEGLKAQDRDREGVREA